MSTHLNLVGRLACVIDDEAAFAQAIRAMGEEELVVVLKYFVAMKMTRDRCTKAARERCKAKHGCSLTWRNIKSDPDKHLSYKNSRRLPPAAATTNVVTAVSADQRIKIALSMA